MQEETKTNENAAPETLGVEQGQEKPVAVQSTNQQQGGVNQGGSGGEGGFCEYWNKWKNQIPALEALMSVIALVLNIIIPGSGTALMAAMVPNNPNCNDMIIVALLQFVLAIVLIGWIWSIIWGVYALQKSGVVQQ